MKRTMLGSLMIGMLAVGALSGCSTSHDKDSMEHKTTSDQQKADKQSDKMDKDSQKMDKNSDKMDKDSSKDAMGKSGYISYQDYQKEPAKYASGKTVLFFNAKWCPSCVSADQQFKQESADIPKDVTVVSVDFDDNQDLKQKYGVVIQHTFVQIDKDGKALKQWSGGGIERLKEQI